MTESISEPLGLEDQCLLHLICHLEEYLPETLASLPLHLRHRLLLNLPAADIYRLENTPISAGIDMECTVWQKLAKIYTRPYQKGISMTASCAFTSVSFTEIIKDNLSEVQERLFSARFCVDSHLLQWGEVQHKFMIMPSRQRFTNYPVCLRHTQHFSEHCQQAYLLSSLVKVCRRIPLQICVNDHGFASSTLWKERDKFVNTIGQVFSGVQELKFGSNGCDTTIEFILAQVFSSPQPISSVLDLTSITDNAIGIVSRFLSRTVDANIQPNSNLPYRGLSTISISLYARYSASLDHSLRSLILCQSSLKSFTLCGQGTLSVSLMSTLGSLFFRLQFEELKFWGVGCVWDNFSVLLSQFLSAPSSEDHEMALCLNDIDFSGLDISKVDSLPAGDGRISSCEAGTCVLPQKAFVIRTRSFQGLLNLFKCLSLYNYTQLVSSLTVHGCLFREHMSSLDTMFPNTTMLQNLKFDIIPLKHLLYSTLSFTNLFQSPHLKLVHLVRCDIGIIGLLPALTEGLKQQLSVGSLEGLNLANNKLDASTEMELQAFFDVLFSLPQLASLELNLRQNCLKQHHSSIMYSSWRRNARQLGLKCCDITGRGGQCNLQDITQLQQVALSGDFMTCRTLGSKN